MASSLPSNTEGERRGQQVSEGRMDSLLLDSSTSPEEQRQQQSSQQQEQHQSRHCSRHHHAMDTLRAHLHHPHRHHSRHHHHHCHRESSGGTDGLPPPPPYSEVPGTVPLHSGRSSGPPPSYEDVINPDAPPPSYQSLFGQVREARKSSKGFVDFIRKLLLILLGTLGVTILLGFTVLIPLTMVAVGASHMDDCPAENIPTFLLVGGLVWVFKNLLNFWSTCRRTSESPEVEADIQARHRKYESFLNCFLFGWFIAGCVLVYRVYPPVYDDPSNPNYCHRTVYLYAFWLVTSTFIMFGLFIGCICCLTISSTMAASRMAASNRESNPEAGCEEPGGQ